jgi:hypothetical protein
MKPITRLVDARVLRKIGVPLSMPVEERFFSKEYSSRWIDLQNAHDRFMSAVQEHDDGPRAGSLGKWRLVERRFADLHKEMQKCDASIGKLLGGEGLSKVHLDTASEQDQHEGQSFAWFLTERAMPFVEFWQRTFDAAADEGGTVTIEPGDIPPWVDET